MHPAMIKINVIELMRETALLTVPETAVITGVDERTIRRWRSKGECPLLFINFCKSISGDLGALPGVRGRVWSGWKISKGGDLYNTNYGGYGPEYFDPDYLTGLYFYFGKINSHEARQNRRILELENYIESLHEKIERIESPGSNVIPLNVPERAEPMPVQPPAPSPKG